MSNNFKISPWMVAMGIIRMVLLWIIVLGTIMLLSGCGPTIQSGSVIDKKFVPEHEDSDPIWIDDVYCGESYYTVPDKWYITIEKKGEDDRMHQRTIQVSEDTFNRLKEGDWYAIPEN